MTSHDNAMSDEEALAKLYQHSSLKLFQWPSLNLDKHLWKDFSGSWLFKREVVFYDWALWRLQVGTEAVYYALRIVTDFNRKFIILGMRKHEIVIYNK